MQRRYVLALGLAAGTGLLSAQQGPACPYAHANRAAALSTDATVIGDQTPGGGSFLGLGRTAIFAP